MHYLRWWKHGDPLFIPVRSFRRPVRDRLFANTVTLPSGCIVKVGTKEGDGYAQLQIDGQIQLAHRVAFELEHGTIPDGVDCLHRCDNPPCFNEAHLFLGTQLDNTRDMISKGRQIILRGDAAPWSKLTADDVRSIRSSTETNVALAAKFNVSPTCISKARTGATWATL
jgi:hypothetical protein